jgi:Na+/melibiose symporter-like transporter
MMLAGKTALFAALIAAAGLPLYIHLPRFATAELGLSLSAVGTILIALRIVDFVQDPAIGWLVDRLPRWRAALAASATLGLAAGFALLFGVAPPVRADLWMAFSLLLLFTAYSLATILLYGQGIALAETRGASGHLRVAAFREAGVIAGVVLSAAAPSLLAAAGLDAYRAFGLLLAAAAVLVWAATRDLWRLPRAVSPGPGLARLHAAGATPLLLLALVNALPVALTSTLFLFFVEDRLALAGSAGLFLILFFASAGLSAPLWARAAGRHGARAILLAGMSLSVAAFIGAAGIPAGGAAAFAVICIASGAALGADMVVLPALFSARLSAAALPSGQAFGLWAFVSKAALALAAITALPFLEARGYRPGGPNPPEALAALTFAYALLPCLLKLAAIALVVRLPERAIKT